MRRWLAACALGIGMTLSAQTYEGDRQHNRIKWIARTYNSPACPFMLFVFGTSSNVLMVWNDEPWTIEGSDQMIGNLKDQAELLGFKKIVFAQPFVKGLPGARCETYTMGGISKKLNIYREEHLY